MYTAPTWQYIELNLNRLVYPSTRSQRYGFSSSIIWVWELDHKKAECQRIGAFELWCWRSLLESSDYKEIRPVSPKGNQSWVFIGRTDA